MALLPRKANTPENSEKVTARTPFANGKHAFTITKSEFKATKAKTGHYLALFCKCFEGPEKGKVYFMNLNLDNPNQVAVDIAEKELNSLCESMGLVGVEDSIELYEKPFILELAQDVSNPQYPGNKIVGFFPYNGGGQTIASGAVGTGAAPSWVPNTSTAAQPDPEPQNPTPPEPAAAKKLPWEK